MVMPNNENIEDLVLREAKENRVVISTFAGYLSFNLDAFIYNQPVDGLLYDLNRSRETVLTFIDDPKWVNDFAVSLVIEKLRNDNDALRAKLREINA
jgi:hypothetical protein